MFPADGLGLRKANIKRNMTWVFYLQKLHVFPFAFVKTHLSLFRTFLKEECEVINDPSEIYLCLD